MKRTIIKYRKQGTKFTITAIENVATVKEIGKSFGGGVALEYARKSPRYWKGENTQATYVVPPTGKGLKIKIGQPYPQSFFEFIIATMKQAGDALGQIVTADRESRVREIVI